MPSLRTSLCMLSGPGALSRLRNLTILMSVHDISNNFELRLHCWREFTALCFSTNKRNYARYGAYCCMQLENMEIWRYGEHASRC